MSQVGVFSSGGSGSSSVLTLTGNSGGAVGPNGSGNITITGSGNVLVSGTTGTNSFVISTVTVSSTTSISSPLAPNTDNFSQYCATAQSTNLTINADSGSPTDGKKLVFRFKDNGTPVNLTWTTGTSKSYRVVGVTLPTVTVASKTVYVGCIYNSADARWDAVAVAQEA